MLTLFFYIVIILFTVYLIQRNKEVFRYYNLYKWRISQKCWFKILFVGLLCLSPIIIIFTLRENVGQDFNSYKEIYELIHKIPLAEYWEYHKQGLEGYYIEPGYYILNRIAGNFRLLLLLETFCMYIPVLFGLYWMNLGKNIGFALFLYFITQFLYSMNVTRFSIAVSWCFLGIIFILKEKYIYFLICILVATSFHITALICLTFYLLKEFKNSRLNIIRNIAQIIVTVIFPFLYQMCLIAISHIPLFARFFWIVRYRASEINFQFFWMLHIIPIIVPIIFLGKEFMRYPINRTIFRIYLLEIPLRIFGLANHMYTRLTRFPQITIVLLIPFFLRSVNRRTDRVILLVYYIGWFFFYYIYSAIVTQSMDAIPYHSIIGTSG